MYYQLLRRSCLAMTLAALVAVPAWHLGNLYEVAGLVGAGPWARLADATGLSGAAPRILGVLWSVETLGVELLDPLAGLRPAAHCDRSLDPISGFPAFRSDVCRLETRAV